MNILISNDDGVEASQLPALIKWCRQHGSVTVVVPKSEQSAKSHSIEIRNPFEIKQRELEPGITVWTVDSTPADCVRFAVSGLQEHYDLMISGINRGYNLGKDTMYSGTLAAASEAVSKGIPAIALSASMKYYDRAASQLDELFRFFREHKLMDIHSLYNVNIPVDPKGIRITKQGSAAFREVFIQQENDMYFPGGTPMRADGTHPDLDTDAVAMGYISVTPMVIDRTAHTVVQQLTQEL